MPTKKAGGINFQKRTRLLGPAQHEGGATAEMKGCGRPNEEKSPSTSKSSWDKNKKIFFL